MKIKYLLPLIIKIQNNLNNSKIFIRLSFKEIYYNIYIKEGNI